MRMPGRRPTTGTSNLGASEPYASGTGGAATKLSYGISGVSPVSMLSETSYSRVVIQTAVRNRDYRSVYPLFTGVAQSSPTAPVRFPTVSKDGRRRGPIRAVHVIRPFRLQLLLVDGLGGGLAECGYE